MRHPIRLFAGLAVFAACLAAAEPLPTPAEIHQLFDDGKYPLVLQRLQRVLPLKGAAAEPYDRHDLLRLKGETHLRMGAQAPAAQAFADAAAATKDADAAGTDRATALLVKRSSPQLAYTPKARPRDPAAKPPAADPIPVVEPESRKKALAALFGDELAAVEPKVTAAARAAQLPPVLDVLSTLHDLRALEAAATGGDAGTKKMAARLGTHAVTLMTDAVTAIGRDVELVEKNAGQWDRVTQISGEPRVRVAPAQPTPQNAAAARIEPRWRKRGLQQQDAQVLRNALATLERIAAAGKDLADAAGDGARDFDAVRSKAAETAGKADRVLNEDYTKTYTRPQS